MITINHRLLYKWTMHEKSPSITTDPNTEQNENKLVDSVIRMHFRMFLYLVTCFLRATVSLLCRLQAVSNLHVPIYPYLISEARRNCSILLPAQQRNRDSQETCYQT